MSISGSVENRRPVNLGQKITNLITSKEMYNLAKFEIECLLFKDWTRNENNLQVFCKTVFFVVDVDIHGENLWKRTSSIFSQKKMKFIDIWAPVVPSG